MNLVEYVRSVIEENTQWQDKMVIRSGRECIERTYKLSEEKEVVVALGTNGFITSVYTRNIKEKEKQ